MRDLARAVVGAQPQPQPVLAVDERERPAVGALRERDVHGAMSPPSRCAAQAISPAVTGSYRSLASDSHAQLRRLWSALSEWRGRLVDGYGARGPSARLVAAAAGTTGAARGRTPTGSGRPPAPRTTATGRARGTWAAGSGRRDSPRPCTARRSPARRTGATGAVRRLRAPPGSRPTASRPSAAPGCPGSRSRSPRLAGRGRRRRADDGTRPGRGRARRPTSGCRRWREDGQLAGLAGSSSTRGATVGGASASGTGAASRRPDGHEVAAEQPGHEPVQGDAHGAVRGRHRPQVVGAVEQERGPAGEAQRPDLRGAAPAPEARDRAGVLVAVAAQQAPGEERVDVAREQAGLAHGVLGGRRGGDRLAGRGRSGRSRRAPRRSRRR